jgi:hypothetical protein
MKRTPIIVLEDKNNYSILYFVLSDDYTTPMFQSVDKRQIKNPTPDNILTYMMHYGEDTEIDIKDLTNIFKGDRIVAIIP